MKRIGVTLAQLIGGLAAGVVLFLLIEGLDPQDYSWGCIFTIVGVMFGMPAGISAGVFLVGRLLGQEGSLWLTLLGAVAGYVVAVVLFGEMPVEAITWLASITMSALATLGFNLGLKRTQTRSKD